MRPGSSLCDQICQATVKGSSVTATTNFNLAANHELAISAIVGNIALRRSRTLELAPCLPRSRMLIADNLDTGGRVRAHDSPPAGPASPEEHRAPPYWPRSFPREFRTQPPAPAVQLHGLGHSPAGTGHASWTSQPYPVNPKPGSTLMTFLNGSIYNPSIDCGSVVGDRLGRGHVVKAGESGPDDHTGINISCWVCDSAVGGPTELTVAYSNASQQLACLLLEFANPATNLKVQTADRRTFGKDLPRLSSSAPVAPGDIAFAYRTSIFVLPQGPGSPAWKQIMSDTTGANALMMLNTPGGTITVVVDRSWYPTGALTCCS